MCHVRLRLSKDFRRYGHKKLSCVGASCQASPRRRRRLSPVGPSIDAVVAEGDFLPPVELDATSSPLLCSGSLSTFLWSVHSSKKKKVTRKGEKQNRKTVSKSRNRSLSNHYGNGEVTIPGKPGMKQPHTPRTERCIFNVICNKGRW